jgi:hypothetical protein
VLDRDVGDQSGVAPALGGRPRASPRAGRPWPRARRRLTAAERAALDGVTAAVAARSARHLAGR